MFLLTYFLINATFHKCLVLSWRFYLTCFLVVSLADHRFIEGTKVIKYLLLLVLNYFIWLQIIFISVRINYFGRS